MRIALSVVLQRLGPAERVAFVLHDVFRLPFESIAEHRAVTERFMAACANGDLDTLVGVLAPDVWAGVDW